MATCEQWRANIALTNETMTDALPDFRAGVREGWSSYIKSTYGAGISVKDSIAVHDTETLVVSNAEEAPDYSNYS